MPPQWPQPFLLVIILLKVFTSSTAGRDHTIACNMSESAEFTIGEEKQEYECILCRILQVMLVWQENVQCLTGPIQSCTERMLLCHSEYKRFPFLKKNKNKNTTIYTSPTCLLPPSTYTSMVGIMIYIPANQDLNRWQGVFWFSEMDLNDFKLEKEGRPSSEKYILPAFAWMWLHLVADKHRNCSCH